MPWNHAHSALVARRSVAITTGTSVDRRRSAPNSQKDCLLSYIASILQGPSGSAGACWASTPHAKAAYIPLRGGGFDRYMGHYVFMHFAPSFLPSRTVRVTRIRRSSHRRRSTFTRPYAFQPRVATSPDGLGPGRAARAAVQDGPINADTRRIHRMAWLRHQEPHVATARRRRPSGTSAPTSVAAPSDL